MHVLGKSNFDLSIQFKSGQTVEAVKVWLEETANLPYADVVVYTQQCGHHTADILFCRLYS